MAKKTLASKTYRAKVNLPGGCVKDALICDGKYVATGKPCPYDCANEKNFFEEILPPKYPVDTAVILKEPLMCKLCDVQGNQKYGRNTFTLPAYTEFFIKGEIKKNTVLYIVVSFGNQGNYYLIPEKNIQIAEVYFYVSSKGIIHHSYVGRDTGAEKFRKLVGNFHKTKIEAEGYKNKLIVLAD
jgi:hypothetical protein